MVSSFRLRLIRVMRRPRKRISFLSQWLNRLNGKSSMYRARGMDFEAGLLDKQAAALERLQKELQAAERGQSRNYNLPKPSSGEQSNKDH